MKKILRMATAIGSGLKSLVKGATPAPPKKERTVRRVMVTNDCQTGGVAAALQVIFPNDEVIPLTLPSSSNFEARSKFIEKLKSATIWVSSGGYDLLKNLSMHDQPQLIRIPMISFSGFHPDIVYARKKSTNELTLPHYNSAIAVWAYKNRLEISAAEKLFNKKTFAELGYLDHWAPSIDELRLEFKNSDLEFGEFFLPMRREGLFMYSLNHPKVMALVRLAKLTAQKMGAGKEVLDKYIDINEGLNEVIWPIYPEIGENLSLHSGYEWKMGEGQWIVGVHSFLKNAYESYARQKISPDDIIALRINEELYDHVLGAQARRENHDQPL